MHNLYKHSFFYVSYAFFGNTAAVIMSIPPRIIRSERASANSIQATAMEYTGSRGLINPAVRAVRERRLKTHR